MAHSSQGVWRAIRQDNNNKSYHYHLHCCCCCCSFVIKFIFIITSFSCIPAYVHFVVLHKVVLLVYIELFFCFTIHCCVLNAFLTIVFELLAFGAAAYLLRTPLIMGGPPDSFRLWDLLMLYVLCKPVFVHTITTN